MPTTIVIPAQFTGRRMKVPHYWQYLPYSYYAAATQVANAPWLPTFLNVVGACTVTTETGAAATAQDETNGLIDLAKAANPACKFALTVLDPFDGVVPYNLPSIALPLTNPGTVAVKTSGSVGTILLTAGYDITTPVRVDLAWAGGSRYNVLTGAFVGDTLSVSSGSGTDLPVATTAITVTKSVGRDPTYTAADADVMAGNFAVFLAAAKARLVAKSVTPSLIIVDAELFYSGYMTTATPTNAAGAGHDARWLAARIDKYAQATAIIEAAYPGVPQHWYSRGWTIATISAAGVLTGAYLYSPFSDLNHAGTYSDTVLTMPQFLAACADTFNRRGESTPTIAKGASALTIWLGAHRTGKSLGGDPQDYDEDYGTANAYALGQWVSRSVRPHHVLLYPPPGIANGTNPDLSGTSDHNDPAWRNPFWWTHFNAYAEGWFVGESSSSRISPLTMKRFLNPQ